MGLKEESGRSLLTFSIKHHALPSMRNTAIGRNLFTWDHLDAVASTGQNKQTSLTRDRISYPWRHSEPESQHANGAHPLLRPCELRLRPLTGNIIYKSYREFVGDIVVDGIIILQ